MFRVTKTPLERFYSMVREDPQTGCWIWLGSRQLRKDGKLHYGKIHMGSRTTKDRRSLSAHRFAIEVIGGRSVPVKAEVHHICRNPGCVNPEHLEIVDHLSHTRGHFEKIVCVHGHPYSGDNLGMLSTTGKRYCRACLKLRRNSERDNAYHRRKYAEQKLKLVGDSNAGNSSG